MANYVDDFLNEIIFSRGLSKRNSYESLISSIALYYAEKENNQEMIDLSSKYSTNDIEINKYLDEIEPSDLDELVIKVLKHRNQGFMYNETSPFELSELVLNLLEVNGSGEIVFDLGCGDGTFLANTILYAKKHNISLKEIVGTEIVPNMAGFAKMVIYILTRNYVCSSRIYTENTLLRKEIDFPYTHSYVMPPFGIKNNGVSQYSTVFDVKFTQKSLMEWQYVDKMLEPIGTYLHRAAAVLPLRALFNDGDIEYRNELLRHGYIESIIELPGGSLYGTMAKIALVIFSTNNEKVKFIDASKEIDLYKYGKQKLPVSEILEMVNDENALCIDNSSLIGLKSLVPDTIILSGSVPQIENGIAIKDVAEVFTGCQYTIRNFSDDFSKEETNYQILTSSDIVDGVINWGELQYINHIDKKFEKYSVKQSDLIITSKSTKVKLAVVDINPNRNIIVTGAMIIVRPNLEKVDPTFLKLFLESENGQKAMQLIQKGTAIKSMLAKDVAEIIIPNVDISKQRSMADKYNSKLSTLIAFKKEVEALEVKLSNFFNEELEGED